MKTNLLSLTLAITVLAASAAVACDQTKAKDVKKATNAVDKSKKTQAASPNDKGGVLLTGSYIKQNIRRSGHITDGALADQATAPQYHAERDASFCRVSAC